jgi:hypothetical protein
MDANDRSVRPSSTYHKNLTIAWKRIEVLSRFPLEIVVREDRAENEALMWREIIKKDSDVNPNIISFTKPYLKSSTTTD